MIGGFNHVDVGTIDISTLQVGVPFSLSDDIRSKFWEISIGNIKPLMLTGSFIVQHNSTIGDSIVNVSVIMSKMQSYMDSDIASVYLGVTMTAAPVLVVIAVTETEAALTIRTL